MRQMWDDSCQEKGMRRRTYGTGKVEALRIRIEPRAKARLEKRARLLGMSVAECARQAIEKVLEEEHTA